MGKGKSIISDHMYMFLYDLRLFILLQSCKAVIFCYSAWSTISLRSLWHLSKEVMISQDVWILLYTHDWKYCTDVLLIITTSLLSFQILQTLTIQATGGAGSSAPSDVSSSGVSRSMIKERSVPQQNDLFYVPWQQITIRDQEIVCSFGRFKSFNVQFEELHAIQSQWTIPDQELRDNLRLAVAEVLLPAYRSFINRFGYVQLSFSSFSQVLHQISPSINWLELIIIFCSLHS